MVTGNAVENLVDAASAVSPVIMDKLSGMIMIFKALGVIAIVYISYLIYMAIANFCRRKKLKNIEDKVSEMDEKLDKILVEIERLKKKIKN